MCGCDIRSNTSLDNLLGHELHTSTISIVVTLIDGEVKSISAIKLNVQEARAMTQRLALVEFRSLIAENYRRYSGAKSAYERQSWDGQICDCTLCLRDWASSYAPQNISSKINNPVWAFLSNKECFLHHR